MAAMKRLLVVVALAAMVGAVPSSQPMTQKEVLDLFLSSVDARHRFVDAVRKMGVSMEGWSSVDVLTPPWANPVVMAGANRAANDAFDKLIATLRRYIETLAEPLKIEGFHVKRQDPTLNVDATLANVTIYKLSTFNIEDKDINFFNVSGRLKVSFEKLDLHGTYKVDATASQQLHVYGDGHFDIRLYEPTVELALRLGYNAEHFNLEDLHINLQLSKLKVIMSNFLGGGEVGDLICGIVSDVGPAFLEEYREEVSSLLSSEVKDFVNVLLAKVDINQIIDVISGGGSGS